MEDNMIFRALLSLTIVATAVIAALNSNAPAKTKPQSTIYPISEILPGQRAEITDCIFTAGKEQSSVSQ
jgi:hypothetical protein